MPTTNEQIADGIIAYRLRLLRSEAATVQAMLGVFDEGLGAVMDEMAAIGARQEATGRKTTAELRRLRALARDLSATAQATEEALVTALSTDLGAVAAVTARTVARTMVEAFPPSVRAVLGGVPVLDVAEMVRSPIGGVGWADRLAEDIVLAEKAVKQSLAVSLSRGASVPKSAKALKAAAKLADTYRGRQATIVRTEFQRVANQAAARTFQENRAVLRGVIHLSTLDSRTCLICAPLHQQRWMYGPDGELLPNPNVGEHRPNPQHPNCRCMDTPWVKSWRDLGIPVTTRRDRERLDGKAPERMTYADWFGRQSQATQVEILGPERYRRWKAGESIESFTDQGRILTIQELDAETA